MLPSLADAPCAWHGEELVRSDRWIREFQPAQLAALEELLGSAEDRGVLWHQLTSDDVPTKKLATLVDDIREELENGAGLLKLRGLPVERYTEEQLRTIYFGLGLALGTPVHQNRRGELMRLIRDEGAGVGAEYGQIEQATMADGTPFLSSYARTLTNGALRHHTDRTDVVALLCVGQAASGGVSSICSSVSVMNEMANRRPDLAEVLFEPMYRSRHGEESDDPADVYPLPVFGVRDGEFTSHFSLTYIEAAHESGAVPALTDVQAEALTMLLDVARDLSFEMVLEPGDIQFLNSHVTYHGRSPFVDDAAAARSRLLMRLWLSMPNSRSLPEDHRILWRNVEAGVVRGGIGQQT